MTQKIRSMPQVVADKFAAYPDDIQKRMHALRGLAIGCEGEPHIDAIEETLKWGEPSYLAKHGSTVRMDWKEGAPQQIGLYFNCNSSLIETFKEIYGDLFRYEKNRAVLLAVDGRLPSAQIKHCILLALSYHKRKHLPLLGA